MKNQTEITHNEYGNDDKIRLQEVSSHQALTFGPDFLLKDQWIMFRRCHGV